MIIGLLLLALTGAHAAPDPSTPEPTSVPTPDPATDPASGAPSRTGPERCPPSPPDRSAAFSEELRRAKHLYRSGCHGWALEVLQDLDLRRRLQTVPETEDIEQRKYLGEVLLVVGRKQEARDTFLLLLREHPDAYLGLLEHSPEAVELFDTVRAEIENQRPDPIPTPDIPPRPLITYLPLGVAHFKAGDRGRGRAYAFSEGALIGVTAVTYVLIPRGDPGTYDEQVLRRILPLRIMNISATAGIITLYAISQADASNRWRRRHRTTLIVSPTGVGIQGRF